MRNNQPMKGFRTWADPEDGQTWVSWIQDDGRRYSTHPSKGSVISDDDELARALGRIEELEAENESLRTELRERGRRGGQRGHG